MQNKSFSNTRNNTISNDFSFSNLLVEHCYTEEELKASNKPIIYYHALNGLFQIRRNKIGSFSVCLSPHEKAGKDYFDEHMKLNLPKIPEEELFKIQNFFKDVCDIHGSNEAMVHIYWNKKLEKYVTISLEQTVSAAHVSYRRNKYYEMNEDMILVMDIHSHDTMSAFFSGVDDRDEKETRLFGVVGHVTSPQMETKFRYGVAGHFVILDKYDIFERSSKSLEEIGYPKEWMDNLKTYKSIYYDNYKFNNNYTEKNDTNNIKEEDTLISVESNTANENPIQENIIKNNIVEDISVMKKQTLFSKIIKFIKRFM